MKNYLSLSQHGFTTARRSTITNLCCFTQYVMDILDKQGQTDTIYLGFSKALDRINNRILLNKLKNIGFGSQLLELIRSYLLNRQYFVSYSMFSSSSKVAKSGVPQGSNLRQLLFVVFLIDLPGFLYCHVFGRC